MPRARTKARKRALDILFESEARGVDPRGVLVQRRETDDAPPVSDYAAMLVEGVVAHRDRIDQLLAEHAEGWTVARMPAVDRNLLRIAVFELCGSTRSTTRGYHRGRRAGPDAVDGRLAALPERRAEPHRRPRRLPPHHPLTQPARARPR
jgi:hypothetical protein